MRPNTRWGKLCFLIDQIVAAAIVLCPIVYAVNISLLPLSQIFKKPPQLIPETLDFSYYAKAFQRAPLLRYLINTFSAFPGLGSHYLFHAPGFSADAEGAV